MKRTVLFSMMVGLFFAVSAQSHIVPSTNIDRKGYPRINDDLSVEFQVKAS